MVEVTEGTPGEKEHTSYNFDALIDMHAIILANVKLLCANSAVPKWREPMSCASNEGN